jgi:hypothetical protein
MAAHNSAVDDDWPVDGFGWQGNGDGWWLLESHEKVFVSCCG